jgi:hypothetical protein
MREGVTPTSKVARSGGGREREKRAPQAELRGVEEDGRERREPHKLSCNGRRRTREREESPTS